MTEKPDLSKNIENARSLLNAALAAYKQLDVDLYAQQTNGIKNYLWLSVSIIGGLWAIVIQAEPDVLDHLFSFALWKATFIPTLGVSFAMIWLGVSTLSGGELREPVNSYKVWFDYACGEKACDEDTLAMFGQQIVDVDASLEEARTSIEIRGKALRTMNRLCRFALVSGGLTMVFLVINL